MNVTNNCNQKALKKTVENHITIKIVTKICNENVCFFKLRQNITLSINYKTESTGELHQYKIYAQKLVIKTVTKMRHFLSFIIDYH